MNARTLGLVFFAAFVISFLIQFYRGSESLVYDYDDFANFEKSADSYPGEAKEFLPLRKAVYDDYEKSHGSMEYWKTYLKMIDLQSRYGIVFNQNSMELHMDYERLKRFVQEKNPEFSGLSASEYAIFESELLRLRDLIWNREILQFLRPATKQDYEMCSEFSKFEPSNVYVALENFKTVGNDAVIIVPPGVKWLGGDMESMGGKTILCYHEDRDKNRKTPFLKANL